jgi:hypothetical protein
MRQLVIASMLFCVAAVARADTFVIDYANRTPVDPAETFETDCLGASEAADCAARAALLEAELTEALGELEGLSDDATQALFSAAVSTDSPAVQQIGLRYFAGRQQLPTSLWASVKEFFLGPDPQVGQPSAEILGFSSDTTDQKLSELYLAFRPSDGYSSNLPSHTGEQDEWAEACARDLQLDQVPAFSAQEQFTPATRLLMNDRFVTSPLSMTDAPATGFVTDAAKADVVSFFSKLFGKDPYPPVAMSETLLQSLNLELAQLQSKLMSGDQQAIKRFQEVLDQITKAQEGVTVGSVLQLDPDACPDCVFWIAGSADDVYTKPLTRAVVVGTQPQLNKTAISYLGNGGSALVTADGGVTNQSDAGTSPGSDQGSDEDGRDASSDPTKKSDGGCSTHEPSAVTWWPLLLTLLFCRRRRHGQFI